MVLMSLPSFNAAGRRRRCARHGRPKDDAGEAWPTCRGWNGPLPSCRHGPRRWPTAGATFYRSWPPLSACRRPADVGGALAGSFRLAADAGFLSATCFLAAGRWASERLALAFCSRRTSFCALTLFCRTSPTRSDFFAAVVVLSFRTDFDFVLMSLRFVLLQIIADNVISFDIVEVVSVEVDLRPVDVAPVNILELDVAVEVAIVEAVVAVYVEVATVPVTAPNAPIVPVDSGAKTAPVTATAKNGATGL